MDLEPWTGAARLELYELLRVYFVRAVISSHTNLHTFFVDLRFRQGFLGTRTTYALGTRDRTGHRHSFSYGIFWFGNYRFCFVFSMFIILTLAVDSFTSRPLVIIDMASLPHLSRYSVDFIHILYISLTCFAIRCSVVHFKTERSITKFQHNETPKTHHSCQPATIPKFRN